MECGGCDTLEYLLLLQRLDLFFAKVDRDGAVVTCGDGRWGERVSWWDGADLQSVVAVVVLGGSGVCGWIAFVVSGKVLGLDSRAWA